MIAECADILPFHFSCYIANKYLLHRQFSATFLSLFCILLVILLFKMTTKFGAKVLASVPKCKKAVMGLILKIHVLDGLQPGMSYSAVGWEFHIMVNNNTC